MTLDSPAQPSASSPPPPRAGESLLLLLDLNETLIRTGELTPAEGLAQTQELSEFAELCRLLTEALGSWTLAFTTGNSFEYSRRIEEPLGVKNLTGLELIIASENGLICRSFHRGNLWREKPTEKYYGEIATFLAKLENTRALHGAYYSQGNELRTTIKPTRNAFSPEELSLLERLHQDVLDPEEVRVYPHHFYLDLDPVRVAQEAHSREFGGKYEATKRLTSQSSYRNILAIGDSASDLPMFEAAYEAGGASFLVANHNFDSVPQHCQVLYQPYTRGVNELLTAVLRGTEARRAAPGHPMPPRGR